MKESEESKQFTSQTEVVLVGLYIERANKYYFVVQQQVQL